MEKYERTELTVTVFSEEDVISTSGEPTTRNPVFGRFEKFIDVDR